ncbi:response regulator transcription factor [Pseudoxanthomonas composti]|uniref:Response regulator transcription factor n=1 Tax=Pseudoxanthomonas composti TaxID=2137479 RepID=A0A4Q1JUV1_9GAMM|nr:response regulator transcription factor [Pseudoxanthomonas composti]RXR04255.1 response regulator transcription factor [Pseudoxanthomonas composti]
MTSDPAAAPLRTLLLEDDPVLRERILVPGLRRFGFAVDGCGTGAELQQRLEREGAEIVVLDVGLPDTDGFTLAGTLRQRYPEIGIVMLTSLGQTEDRIRGLTGGADAYLAKPVELDLLAATLHSLARRVSGRRPAPPTRARWQLSEDGWCLLSPSGAAAALTGSERRLCQRLLEQPGLLVAREALIAALTERVYDFDAHRLDSMVHRLRSKVQRRCGEPLPLSAVHGQGYIFDPAA